MTLIGRSLKIIAISLLAALWTPYQTAADPDDDFSFDIYAQDENVEVWVDINQLVSESHWSRLKDGGEIAFEFSFSLTVPRKLFGESEAVKNEQAIKLSYHIVTETYYCGFSSDQFENPVRFASMEDLSQYLADSLTFAITEIDKLDSDRKHTLKIAVTRVSIADLSRYATNDDNPSANSPLEPLFRAFLNLTQFGRQEFRARSRPLSVDELTE